MNRISCRSAVVLSVLAWGLAWPSASFAADNAAPAKAPDAPASDAKALTETPSAPAPAASAPTSGTSGVNASASASAELGAGASGAAEAAGEEPSLEHPAIRAPGARRCGTENIPQGDHPEYVDRRCYGSRLEAPGIFLYGGLETDTGYAKYTYQNQPAHPYEDFYDMRGRFVAGPMLHHEFGKSGFFVRATGQMVAWLRDRAGNQYQINADDVYGQVGGRLGAGHWDFQIGRFQTWRVYHKGLGFDLYTLEDTGANQSGSVAGGTAAYAVHTYEVNYIFYRQGNLPYVNEEFAGKMAFHYFPTEYLGFELTGVYGQSGGGQKNTMGGRLAGDFHKTIGPVGIRASFGAEDRWEHNASPKMVDISSDPTQPNYQKCSDCLMRDNKGLGGSGIVTVSIIEAGGGLARGWDLAHQDATSSVNSARDPKLSGVRTTYGGYLQVDPGKLLFGRSLILGAGLQHTELVLKTNDYQTHLQGAAYVAFPLGFNDAVVKLVLSRAEAANYVHTSAPGAAELTFNKTESAMTAGRLRFAYYF